MDLTIYMPLLNEGTDCWRPVQATLVAEDIFEVGEELPEGESWAFAPGSRVRCRKHVFTTGESGLVAYEYALSGNPLYELLKAHEGEMFHVAFTDGEEAVIRVLHVDEGYEDFIYDLVSTNREHQAQRASRDAAYASKFDDLLSARLLD